MSIEMNRRTFVNGAVAVAGAAALSPLLSACGGGSTSSKGGTSSKAGLQAALPTYVEGTAVNPDIPSVNGVVGTKTSPGYLAYPANPVKTVSGVPGKGGSYTAIVPAFGALPDPGNSFYQAMNKALGVNLTMKPADGVNYGTVVPTMTAAKKLPDWIQLPTWETSINIGELVGTQLADLTPYLAGDKIKQYPNLAAIPTGAWTDGAWEDKVYGIPCFSSGFSLPGTTFFRRDVFDAKGITADQVKSAADLFSLGKELTDAKGGVWAFGDVWTYLSPLWGVPYKFTLADGKLVHKYEMDQFLEALDWHYKLAKSGYMHPDTLAGNNSAGGTRFYAGHTLITGDGLGAWNLGDAQTGTAASKNYRRGAFSIFAADGKSTPSTFLGAATTYVSYFNIKLSKDQILELLEVANYLAAPFGSAEYTMVNYGVEGVHYTMVNGVPTANSAGTKYVSNAGYQGLASPPAVVSNPGANQVTKDVCAWQASACQHVYKPVFLDMNVTVPTRFAVADAAQAVEDTIKDCYHGIKKVSDVQAAISSWKSSGGTQLIQWYSDNVLAKYGTGQ
ncbi:ABC transporter substrate-binding protein [Streptacidiphilus carbonis]|uniref:ABC transporter substrate-binding protein n=1 Tax=Streptacidiphilus carbonis TaxID=105422 RepID=UPI001269B164|nr:Tat pathway signal sequence domain protein [Streptacidiphilus carbonis]